jgi:hypothetical protein
MAFVNLSLLLGGLLAAIPVVLHLVLRQQPKRVTFPALRFLKERQESNRRQLQLRQWILLFLRCAALALLAAALARPSVSTAALGNWLVIALLGMLLIGVVFLAAFSLFQKKGKWFVGGLSGLAIVLGIATTGLLAGTLSGNTGAILGDQQAPVAAVLVVDTSPRMEYRFRNQTRLELAKETGMWLLSQFPAESTVAVMESRPGPPFFSVDLAAAKSTVERLRITGIPDPLSHIATQAVQLVRTSDLTRREIYILTDMAEPAWSAEHAAELRAALEANPEVSVYIIDVGVDQPKNVSLGELQLSAETLVPSSELILSTDVRSLNMPGEYTVELLVEKPDTARPIVVDGKPMLPEAQVRDRKSINLPADGAQRVEFRIRGWEFGTQQGFVRVAKQDGLASDNSRYFAVEVRTAWPVLLVAASDVQSFLLAQALAPTEQRETATARFECREVAQTELAGHELGGYSIVCLHDPQPLASSQWEQLGRYVERGGNLVVFLGANAQTTPSFNEPAAQYVLGAKLVKPWRTAEREVSFSPQRFEHPSLALFREQASTVPWSESPVFRHWSVSDLAENQSVVLSYNNGKPAILERPLGSGRVVLFTTPLAEESRPAGRPPWNELLTSEQAWPNFVLFNELMRYLAGGTESRLNYLAGETAVIVNDATRDPARYQLFTPLDAPQDVLPRDGLLSVPFTPHPGAYRLKGLRDKPIVRGFAVNLPADASNLQRVPLARVEELLGKNRFRYARSRDEIVLEVGEARVGREFYPYLLLVLVVILGLEHTLANRFYRKTESTPDRSSAAKSFASRQREPSGSGTLAESRT